MSDAVISALITGSVTLIGTILANYSMRKKDAISNAVRDQKIEDSLNELSKRVDAHNQLGDKIANIEKSIVKIETTMSNLHK